MSTVVRFMFVSRTRTERAIYASKNPGHTDDQSVKVRERVQSTQNAAYHRMPTDSSERLIIVFACRVFFATIA